MKDLNISNGKWFFKRFFFVYRGLSPLGAVPREAAIWLYSRRWAAKNDRSTWFIFGAFRKIRFLRRLEGFLEQKSLLKSVKIVGKFLVVETRPNYLVWNRVTRLFQLFGKTITYFNRISAEISDMSLLLVYSSFLEYRDSTRKY